MLYKIFIVDDEPLLLNATKELLPWEEYGFTICGSAPNGCDALDFIYSSAPDLLLTDIVMPEMDGLELLKKVKLRFPKMKVIMLSSYDEFRYVQKALQFGATDYILKPNLEASHMLLLLKQLFPLAKQNTPGNLQANLIKSLLEGGAPLHGVQNKGSWALAVILTKSMSPHARLEVWSALEPALRGTAFHRLTQADAEVFLLEEGSPPAFFEHYLLGSGVTSIIVKNITNSENLTLLIQNLTYLKAFPFFMPLCRVLVSEPGDLLPFSRNQSLEESQDGIEALSQLMLFLQNVSFRDCVTPQQLKLKTETVLYDFFVKMDDTGEGLPLLERITFAENMMELRAAYSEIYTKIMKDLKSKHLSCTLMDQIIGYMEQNYSKNISLHDVADSLHFNYSYLSHYFNTQSPINFKEYLNNVRIEKAKQLLAGGGLNISSVCDRTGFADCAYFSRVFRRITGLTPTDYKLSVANAKKGRTQVSR